GGSGAARADRRRTRASVRRKTRAWPARRRRWAREAGPSVAAAGRGPRRFGRPGRPTCPPCTTPRPGTNGPPARRPHGLRAGGERLGGVEQSADRLWVDLAGLLVLLHGAEHAAEFVATAGELDADRVAAGVVG